jgi:hypothetical protein
MRELTVRFVALVEELLNPLRDCPDAEARWSVIEFMRTQLAEGTCPDDEMAMRRYCRKRERLTPAEKQLLQRVLQRSANGGWGLECVEADRQHMLGKSTNNRLGAREKWARYEAAHPGWVPPARRAAERGAFGRPGEGAPDANADANASALGAFGDANAMHPLPSGSPAPAPERPAPPSDHPPRPIGSGEAGVVVASPGSPQGGPGGDRQLTYVQRCPRPGCGREYELPLTDGRVRLCEDHKPSVAMVVGSKDPRNRSFFEISRRIRAAQRDRAAARAAAVPAAPAREGDNVKDAIAEGGVRLPRLLPAKKSAAKPRQVAGAAVRPVRAPDAERVLAWPAPAKGRPAKAPGRFARGTLMPRAGGKAR